METPVPRGRRNVSGDHLLGEDTVGVGCCLHALLVWRLLRNIWLAPWVNLHAALEGLPWSDPSGVFWCSCVSQHLTQPESVNDTDQWQVFFFGGGGWEYLDPSICTCNLPNFAWNLSGIGYQVIVLQKKKLFLSYIGSNTLLSALKQTY